MKKTQMIERIGQTIKSRKSFFAIFLIASLCIITGGCRSLCSCDGYSTQPTELPGIKAESLRLSAEGYMLDFRYRVTDAEKAEQLITDKTKPYMIHERTGAKLIVPAPPKVGSLSQTSNPPKEGKVYFILFANPGRIVEDGDKVSIVLDDNEIKNIEVNRVYEK
ncbi:MAG: hypothetical protein ACIAQZ_10875 [Sedimentisphaeraceae bacterium JB056]